MVMSSLLVALDEFIEAAAEEERDEDVDPLANALTAALGAAFIAQGLLFFRRFRRFQDRWLFAGDVPEREWSRAWVDVAIDTRPRFVKAITKRAETAIIRGARRLITDIRIDLAFRRGHAKAERWLSTHGGELITGIENTTRDRVRTLLAQAQRERWTYPRLERELVDRFQEFGTGVDGATPRARLIAHNEMRTAWEEGRRIVASDLMAGGIELQVKWTTVGDSRVTPQCRANEAEDWIPATNTFSSGHRNPPRFPGCRCHSVYRRSR